MSIIFRAGNPNFPANQAELKERPAEIEELINNEKKVPPVNIKFVEKAFKLMEDWDLITESNIKFLCSAPACQSYDFRLKFLRNYNEGVLRAVEDDNEVYTDGYPRFYPGFDRRVELNGQKYLIVNDWYKDGSACPNKRPFYNCAGGKCASRVRWILETNSLKTGAATHTNRNGLLESDLPLGKKFER